MNVDMEIRPFREHQDDLFTDFAMQIFNAHTSQGDENILSVLMDSYKDDATSNPAFLPGVIFGSMVHMYMMIQMIADSRYESIEETIKFYNEAYNKSRKNLSRMLGNRPEYAKALIQDFIDNFDSDNLE